MSCFTRLATLFVLAVPLAAQPPNDLCANAIPVSGPSLFNTAGANLDGPNNCAGMQRDVWFEFFADCSGTVEVDLCSANPNFDTVVAVYVAGSCPPTSAPLACNDNACGLNSLVSFVATRGVTYLIRIGTKSGQSGIGNFEVRYADANPANDTCQTAEVVTSNTLRVFSNIAAGTDATCATFGVVPCELIQMDVWYLYVAPCTGQATITTCGLTSVDTVLQAYDVNDQVVACNDDDCGTQSSIRFPVFQGEQFYVRLGGNGGACGTGLISFGCTKPILYVDQSAPAGGDGSSWPSALNSLQAALSIANSGNSNGYQIRVASGTYTPSAVDPNASFFVGVGVELRGGYPPGGGTRDIYRWETTLSGDLFGDDTNGGTDAENAHTIVRADDCLLDGLTIRGARGRAHVPVSAAILTYADDASAPTLDHCVLLDNTGTYLVGVAGSSLTDDPTPNSGSITARSCRFVRNRLSGALATGFGAFGADLLFENCTFKANRCDGPLFFAASALAPGPTLLPGSVEIRNSLFDENVCSDLSQAATTTVTYSMGQQDWSPYDSPTNLPVDPQLNPGGFLTKFSPAIDAGDPTSVATGNEPVPRVVGGRIDIGAHEWEDTDLDQLPDFWELLHFGLLAGIDAAMDNDLDGFLNGSEYEDFDSNPALTTYYVDPLNGNDTNLGFPQTPSLPPFGPKRTIQAMLDAAPPAATIRLLPGPYFGSGQDSLRLNNKGLIVAANPSSIVLEGNCQSIQQSGLLGGSLIGLRTLEAGRFMDLSEEQLLLGSMTIDGSLHGERLRVLASEVFLEGDPGCGFNGDPNDEALTDVFLSNPDGMLLRNDAFLNFRGGRVDGDGFLIDSGTTLRILPYADGGQATTTFDNQMLLGTGRVRIDRNATLELINGCSVDLSTSSIGCDPSQAASWGEIEVLGTLLVRDSDITGARLRVLLGSVEGLAGIATNQINLPKAAGDYGGEFFVDGNSSITCNQITSDGDRYLDIDPDPTAVPRPIVQDNVFRVQITQGVGGALGELLELRSRDEDNAIGLGLSGAYQVSSMSPGFDDEWSLEQLEILSNAKVNLTNRPGFEFDNGPHPEALYVHTLMMHPGAVLNTALQRIYYVELVDEFGTPLNPNDPVSMGNRRIVDVPLLGFSLIRIDMEDQTEFDVRIRERLQDERDQACYLPGGGCNILAFDDCVALGGTPGGGNTTCPDGTPARGSIQLTTSPYGGVMEMKTRATGFNSASSVAAHGAFARAGEEQVTIEFLYQFTQANAETAMRVYLSDAPEASDPNRLRLVARIEPPASGTAGGVGGSSLRSFRGTFPVGDLNFRRGTYVELELVGADSAVLVDEFDPRVNCNSLECGDFTGNGVDTFDFLISLSANGQELGRDCLDLGASGDGYTDLGDILAADAAASGTGLNACANGLGLRSGVGTPVSLPGDTNVLLAGKIGGSTLQDILAPLDASLACLGSSNPASVPVGPPFGFRANGRLAVDAAGAVHQIHAAQGLIRLDDASPVIPPTVQTGPGGEVVYVGVHPSAGDPNQPGLPLADVAFGTNDPSVAYVAPVVIEPSDFDPNAAPASPGSPRRFVGAAELLLGGNGTYSISRLFGVDPRNDPNQSVWPPERTGVREIEVDRHGNAYVLACNELNNRNRVLVYRPDGTQRTAALSLKSATAMLVTDADQLHVSQSFESLAGASTRVFSYPITRDGTNQASGLGTPDETQILPPGTLDPNALVGADPNAPLRSITALAEATDGSILAAGYLAANYRVPNSNPPEIATPGELFTIPFLATLSLDGQPVTAVELSCGNLRLPISMVVMPGSPSACGAGCNVPDGSADVTGDCQVDLSDLANVLSAFGASGPDAANGDTNADGTVDLTDLANTLSLFGTSCPG